MTKIPEKIISFTGSKLMSIYTQELYFLCHQIETKSISLFSEFPITSNEVYQSTKIEGLDLIYSILSFASKVKEMTSPGKSNFNKDRATYINNILNGLNLSELLNKSVRNTVEHFSEYLDKANKLHTLFNSSHRYSVAFNLIISNWTPLKQNYFPFQLYNTPLLPLPLYPVRIYISSEKRFYNMDKSIDLATLCNDAISVKNHMIAQNLFEEVAPEDWVSGLLVC